MSKLYLIWSIEHDQWWKPNKMGYTDDMSKAGRYSVEDATEICEIANIVGVEEMMMPEIKGWNHE